MSADGLAVARLAAAYGSVRVLSDVSLTVGRGEIVGLVGPNGAGKTTTLRAISGIAPRTGGGVTLDGADLPARPDVVARAGITHVPEGRGLFPDLTALQNLQYGAIAVGLRPTDAHLEPVLQFFPALRPLLGRKAALLSGGEQQMVAIGRGLAAQPRILMVDELSLGLAPKLVADVLHQLADVVRDRHLGLLLVDQNVRALKAVCDRMYVLTNGTSQEVDAADESIMHMVYFGGEASASTPTGGRADG